MFAVLTGSNQMSTPLENLEQQYAAEVVKVNADEGLLKRLERGIRGLKGVAESTGWCCIRYLSASANHVAAKVAPAHCQPFLLLLQLCACLSQQVHRGVCCQLWYPPMYVLTSRHCQLCSSTIRVQTFLVLAHACSATRPVTC
jgi:hypothetical protein